MKIRVQAKIVFKELNCTIMLVFVLFYRERYMANILASGYKDVFLPSVYDASYTCRLYRNIRLFVQIHS